MATNFYTGLAAGFKEAQDRDQNDELIRQRRERTQALEVNEALDNQRADQKFAMEQANNQRDTAIKEFQFSEAQREAARKRELEEGSAQIYKQFHASRKVKNPDGTEIDVVPDPNDPKVAGGYISSLTNFLASKGAIKREDLVGFYNYGRQLKKDGITDIVTGYMTNPGPEQTQALADVLGMKPEGLKVTTDRSGPFPRTMLNGVRLDGTPFSQDVTSVFISMGLPKLDVDAPGRDAAIDVEKIKTERVKQGAEGARSALYGAQKTALETTGSKNGVTKDIVDREYQRLSRQLDAKNPELGFNQSLFGMGLGTGAGEVDLGKRRWIAENAEELIGRGVRGIQAYNQLWRAYNKLEEQAVGGTKWFKEGKEWRPARQGDDPKLIKSFAQMSSPNKIQIRDRLIDEFEDRIEQEREAEERAKKEQAPKKPK